ncbi:MAG: hypothetical protein ACI9A7_000839 [Cyclobacteriaceae bacterium]
MTYAISFRHKKGYVESDEAVAHMNFVGPDTLSSIIKELISLRIDLISVLVENSLFERSDRTA